MIKEFEYPNQKTETVTFKKLSLHVVYVDALKLSLHVVYVDALKSLHVVYVDAMLCTWTP